MLDACALILPLVVTALQPGAPTKAEPQPEVNWREAEAPLLSHWSQLTFRRDYVKAGEAYFSPDGRRIIFQAVPVPPAGQEPEQHYSMYVADLTRDAEGGPVGISNVRRVSPKGSANTCGWFHPKDENLILFGCTIDAPLAPNKPGFQVGTNKYVWSFPENMKIVTLDLRTLKEGEEPKPTPMFERPGYCAEASWDPSGRYVLYANVDPAKQTGEKPDADIWVYDTSTKAQIPMVIAPGYDGGPFWGIDDGMPFPSYIYYRSDRAGTDMLQLYSADTNRAPDGRIIGVSREEQLTNNSHVNWGPFSYPKGGTLAYSTSEVSHRNYEIFVLSTRDYTRTWDDRYDLNRRYKIQSGSGSGTLVEIEGFTRKNLVTRRVTFAGGADVLPVFSADGKWLMWTSQRGEAIAGEAKPSSQLWIARWNAADPFKQQPPAADPTK